MNIYRLILVLCFALLQNISFAQKINIERRAEVNRYDDQKRKHGWWVYEAEARMGEPSYKRFGVYAHGVKTGPWYKMNDESGLIAVENYRYGALDGESKYYTRGKHTVTGHYKALNPSYPIDTIIVEDPVSGAQQLVPVKSDVGTVRHGLWKYYHELTGELIRIEEYQVDELIYAKDIHKDNTDSLRNVQRINETINAKEHYRPPSGRGHSLTR